jgi:hypothetical protein
MTRVLRQTEISSLQDVSRQLDEAFLIARDAIASDEPLVIVAFAADLLGQGSVENAAVAGGLLGLMRAIVFEGATKGWHVNMVAIDRESVPDDEVMNCAGTLKVLNGQVLNLSSGQFGKLIP